MKVKGRLYDISSDLKTGDYRITVTTSDKSAVLGESDDLMDKDLDVEFKRHREKRSLDANAYCWVLIDRLAEKLRIGKTEIYQNAIRDIGGNNTTVCVLNEAVDDLIEKWQRFGVGWIAEKQPSKLEGCTNVTLYYGSSLYDTEQMSRLIDYIVTECEEQGIDTKTPDEIANLLSLWEEAK